MDSITETPPPPPLPEMIVSLEQAVLMAKQLPATTDPTHLLQIYSSLHQAHHYLSSFLSNTQFPLHPPPPSAAENSLSSAANDIGNEPMQIGDDDEVEAEAEAEENSKTAVEKVEERLKYCLIKNKRPKRPLSPSSVAVAEERRLYDDGLVGGAKGFDTHRTKLRALDLVYQFHA